MGKNVSEDAFVYMRGRRGRSIIPPGKDPRPLMVSFKRQLSKFTAILAGGTMLSRVLGLVRDMAFAVIPAASLDSFLLAFKLPNMLRDLVGEGALNAAFVPVFSETLEKRGEAEFRRTVAATMSAMLILLVVLTLIGVFFIPGLLGGMNTLQSVTGGEARTEAELESLAGLARWTFPYLFFIGMAVFAMGALFVMKHYTTPSWSPALLNVAFIVCLFAFRNRFADPRHALVLGVWVGGVAQFVVMYVALGRRTGVWLPSFQLGHRAIRVVFWLMVPVIIGQATGEVNKLVDAAFAYSAGEGLVTALYYANRLIQLPLSVFGLATAAAVLPAVSKAAARDDGEEIRAILIHGLRQTFFLIMPAFLGLLVLGHPIIQLLFEHRTGFTAVDTDRAATALTIYAFGLVSFAWVRVLVTGFYAVQNTKTPVIIGTACMALNIVLNFLLVRSFSYKGLAFATTISFTVNFVLLYVMLTRRFGPLWDGPFFTALIRIALAATAMAAIAHATHLHVISYFAEDTRLTRLVGVGVPVCASVLAYLGLCWAFQVHELTHFMSLLRRKRG